MRITILSLKGVEYEGEIKSLNIKTQAGEITVLDRHIPLISILEKGVAVVTDMKGNIKKLSVNSGFLKVGKQNSATVLVS